MASDEAKLIVKFEAENKKLHQQLDRTTKRLNRFEKGAKKNVAGVSSAFKGLVGGVALAAFTRKVIESTKTQQAAVKQLEQGLASTGNVVGRSLEELTTKAQELQSASTFGDEEIIGAMSQLVTFTNITGEAFDRTTQAVLDLSTRMDQDLKSSVLQLGKALNDPVANLGALGRAGIQFSDAQKDTIKALAETNRLAEAQDIILKELERQFGGSAAAARDTLAGALASLNNAFGDLFEQKDDAKELTGAVNEMTTAIKDPVVVQAVQNITNAVVTGFSKAVKAITTTINLFKFLGDEVAAFVNGPALGDLPRLYDRLNDLEEKRASIANSSGRNARNKGERLAEVDAEIKRVSELIRLSEEMATLTPVETQAGGSNSVSAPVPAVVGVADTSPYEESLNKVKSLLESIRTPQQEYADNVRTLDSLVKSGKITQGEYNLALSEYNRVLDEATGANAQWLTDVAAAERHAEMAKTEIQKLEEQLAELYALAEREPDLISADTVEARAGQIKERIQEVKDAAEGATEGLSVFAEQAARNSQDAFADFLFDPFNDGLDGLLNNFLRTMQRMAAEAASAKFFEGLFGTASGGSGGAATAGLLGSGGLENFFGGFFADGGFPDPGKISVVGEAGPELFVPNGVRGEIVPNHELGGPSISGVNMNFYGVRTEKEAKIAGGAMNRQLAKLIDGSRRY